MSDENSPVHKRKYKPKVRHPLGMLSPDRAGWVEVGKWEFMLIERDPQDDETEYNEGLPVMVLGIKAGARPPFFAMLSALTEQEVDELEKFFQFTIEELRPVTARLDLRAQQEKEKGNDNFGRLYRQVARFVSRKRHGIEHPAGVQGRPDGLLPMDDGEWSDTGTGERPGDVRGGVPERPSSGDGTQDGASEADESAELRAVDGEA